MLEISLLISQENLLQSETQWYGDKCTFLFSEKAAWFSAMSWGLTYNIIAGARSSTISIVSLAVYTYLYQVITWLKSVDDLIGLVASHNHSYDIDEFEIILDNFCFKNDEIQNPTCNFWLMSLGWINSSNDNQICQINHTWTKTSW